MNRTAVSPVAVNLKNLRRGMDHAYDCLRSKGKPGRGVWEFHNDLYVALRREEVNRLDAAAWDYLIDRLWEWTALRPKSKAVIRDAGRPLLTDMRDACEALARRKDGREVGIEDLSWRDVEPTFSLAARIKAVQSPMFASKLCHFLLPSAFAVTDNKLVRGTWSSYRQYWEDCKAGWQACPDKHRLIRELASAIPGRPCGHYPWATKITELCCFGPA